MKILRVRFTFVLSCLLAVMRFAAAQDPKLAPVDLANYEKTVADGHLIALVELQTGENTFTHYRYDRYPGVERLVLEDGSVYMRHVGDSPSEAKWQETADWGASAGPGMMEGKEADKLDNYAAMIYMPFEKAVHKDLSQGGTVWRMIEKSQEDGYESFTIERSREKPHKDGVYPRMGFIKPEGTKDGHLTLRWATAQVKWDADLIPVKVSYSYKDEKTPDLQPEELLYAAKKITDGGPHKVDLLAGGDANCRVAGIISGRDFDLTVITPVRMFRQISVGDDRWLSEDGGKTWKKQEDEDRAYYYLGHTPVKFELHEFIPPFELVGEYKREDGTVRRIRLIAPETVRYDGDRDDYEIAMDEGVAGGVRHYDGPMVFGRNYVIVHAAYSDLKGKDGVLPPPGNAEAVPETGAEILLMEAVRNMSDGGNWKVEATAEAGKKARITGLLSGADFDLTESAVDGSAPMRSIAIKERAWGTFDGGKTWRKEKPDDRLIYNLVSTPLIQGRMEPPFETLGKEEQGGETLLHIAVKGEEGDDRMQYWLLLDKDGKPLSVRRYRGPVLIGGDVVRVEAGYTQSAEEIKPPEGK